MDDRTLMHPRYDAPFFKNGVVDCSHALVLMPQKAMESLNFSQNADIRAHIISSRKNFTVMLIEITGLSMACEKTKFTPGLNRVETMMGISDNKVLYVDAPNARLRVIVEGTKDDPVVLIHGGLGVPDYLGKVAEILSSRHQVIRYDQRGTGESVCLNGRYGLEDHIEDLEAIHRHSGMAG